MPYELVSIISRTVHHSSLCTAVICSDCINRKVVYMHVVCLSVTSGIVLSHTVYMYVYTVHTNYVL